jgi:hypothetical protein
MTKKNIQCSLVDLRRTTVLQAQGWREFDGVMGSRHRGLGEDGDAADSGTVRVIGVVAWEWRGVHNVTCSGRMMLLRARNGVAGLGMRPALSTAAPARVGEDGGA